MTDLNEESEDADEPFTSETQFIDFLQTRCQTLGMASDFSDDCGYLTTHTDVVSTDTIIEGSHFQHHFASPHQIGRHAAISSLSDLAGSGAEPLWALLSLQIPEGWFGRKLRSLSEGFLAVLSEEHTCLVGGNCARTTGPLSITVTVGGSLFGSTPVARNTARPGDHLYVSGTLGGAALAIETPTPETIKQRHLWRPHFRESRALVLSANVTAMMDISDGLVIDAARMARASNCAFHLHSEGIRQSLPKGVNARYTLEHALYGGEDYVLLFTMPAHLAAPNFAYPIGTVQQGCGLYLDDRALAVKGHDHFTPKESGTCY